MKQAIVWAFVAAILSPVVGGAAESPWPDEPGRFLPLDVFELEWASDPRISPDGRRIVYTRNSMDVMTSGCAP